SHASSTASPTTTTSRSPNFSSSAISAVTVFPARSRYDARARRSRLGRSRGLGLAGPVPGALTQPSRVDLALRVPAQVLPLQLGGPPGVHRQRLVRAV